MTNKDKKDSLGNRMKKYEHVAKHQLMPRSCVIIRVDGRAFHTYTKGMDSPFDYKLSQGMIYAAERTAEDIQGFKVAYIQSDEASFLITDFDSIETQGWFDYDLEKMVSISASTFSVYFNHFMWDRTDISRNKKPTFDSRAFNIPLEDVPNYFLWRAKDWERNSLSMYARTVFSSKQLFGKNKSMIHEMLHSVGKNWTKDLTPLQKNGCFILKVDESSRFILRDNVEPHYPQMCEVVEMAVEQY